MLGASVLKIAKFVLDAGGSIAAAFSGTELLVLGVGTLVSFLVSLVAVKFLVGFVRRHSFEAFGWYRIVVGIVILLYFCFIK